MIIITWLLSSYYPDFYYILLSCHILSLITIQIFTPTKLFDLGVSGQRRVSESGMTGVVPSAGAASNGTEAGGPGRRWRLGGVGENVYACRDFIQVFFVGFDGFSRDFSIFFFFS